MPLEFVIAPRGYILPFGLWLPASTTKLSSRLAQLAAYDHRPRLCPPEKVRKISLRSTSAAPLGK
jgi:hypothetical protein